MKDKHVKALRDITTQLVALMNEPPEKASSRVERVVSVQVGDVLPGSFIRMIDKHPIYGDGGAIVDYVYVLVVAAPA